MGRSEGRGYEEEGKEEGRSEVRKGGSEERKSAEGVKEGEARRDGTPHMSSIAIDSSWRIWERPGKS